MNLVRFNKPRHNANSILIDELFNNYFKNDYHANYMNNCTKSPASNVFETEKEFKIEVLLPGFEKDNVQLNFQNHLLTIKASKQEEETSKELKYVHREFGVDDFEKQYRIPKSVEDKKISAKFENGVLYIELPKKEEALEKAPVEIKVS